MSDSRTLEILLKVKDDATAGLSKIDGKLKDLQPAFKKMAVAGTVAFTAISALAITSFKAFADAEAQTVVSTKSLENTLTSLSAKQLKTMTGFNNVSEALKGSLVPAMDLAGKSALKLGFDDEEAGRAFAKLFSATKDTAQAQKEVAIAMDLARYKNISLEEATSKLMLVHAGATKELKTLGLAVVEGATAIQNMDAIMKQTTGTAFAFGQTASGAMEIMKVNSDNLKESIGQALQPAFKKLAETLIPLVQKFVDWATLHPDLIAKLILVGGAIAGVVAVVGTLGLLLPTIIAGFTLLTGTVGIVIAIIVALGFAVMQVVKIFQLIHDDGKLIWEGIKLYVKEACDAITGWFTSAWNKIKSIIDSIKNAVGAVGSAMKSVGGKVGSAVSGAVSSVGHALGINDGIVQNGQIISTNPMDTIFAMKNPSQLAGAGGGITINLNGTFMSPRETMKQLTDEMAKELKRRLHV
jgi:phage-related minor tail protein